MEIPRPPSEIVLDRIFRDPLRSHQPRVHAAAKLFLQAVVHLFIHRADDKVRQTQSILHVIDPVPREIQVVMVRPRDDDRIVFPRDFANVLDGQTGRQFRLRDRFGFAGVRKPEVKVTNSSSHDAVLFEKKKAARRW